MLYILYVNLVSDRFQGILSNFMSTSYKRGDGPRQSSSGLLANSYEEVSEDEEEDGEEDSFINSSMTEGVEMQSSYTSSSSLHQNPSDSHLLSPGEDESEGEDEAAASLLR
jgi:hypothetical protein